MEEEDGEDFTSMAMDSSSPTDLPFIKANLTLSKFFNVSVPIEDKFNFRWHLDKNNLTEQVSSSIGLMGAKLSEFSGEPTGSAAPHPSLHQLCPLPLQPRLCNVLGNSLNFKSLSNSHCTPEPPQITYITFFNSRVVGALATNLANRFLHLFVKGGYVKVGGTKRGGKETYSSFIFRLAVSHSQ